MPSALEADAKAAGVYVKDEDVRYIVECIKEAISKNYLVASLSG